MEEVTSSMRHGEGGGLVGLGDEEIKEQNIRDQVNKEFEE